MTVAVSVARFLYSVKMKSAKLVPVRYVAPVAFRKVPVPPAALSVAKLCSHVSAVPPKYCAACSMASADCVPVNPGHPALVSLPGR